MLCCPRQLVLGLVAACTFQLSCSSCEPPPPATSFVVESGATRVRVGTAPFSFDVAAGHSFAEGQDCAPFAIALRADADTGAWHRPEAPTGDELWLRPGHVDVVNADKGGPLTLSMRFSGDGKDVVEGTLTVEPKENGWVDLRLRVAQDEVDVAYVSTCLALAGDEHLVGGGERFDGADLRGKVVPLSFQAPGPLASGTNEAHAPVPFLASNKGYAALVDSERVGAFNVGVAHEGATVVRFHGTELVLALRAGDIVENVEALARRMGLPPAPPPWALAPMQWRNDLEVEFDAVGGVVSTGTDMLLRDVSELHARGIPTSTIWIDAPWETGYNTFVFNESQLPGIHAVIADLERQGIRVLTWATEHVNSSDDSAQAYGMPPAASRPLFDEFSATGLLVTDERGEPFVFPWGRGAGGYVDFTNPDACAAFRAQMRPLLEGGVHGFKLDYGETMRADALGLLANDVPRFFDGTTTAVQHTRYARLYHECYLAALEEVHAADRFVITRSGGLYDQKNGTAIWPGDLDSEFERTGEPVGESGDELAVGGIPAALQGYLSLAMSAYPLYGPDIGGYRGGMPSTEAFARWSQLGALSPVMQVGGGGNQAPWDPELVSVIDVYAAAARLHVDLFPMWEEWTARAARNGTPIAVPVGVVADVVEAWADEATFVLGGSLLAAPVVEANARTRTLYVPAGRWHSWWDESVIEGPGVVSVDAPLERVPLWIAADALVVLADPRLMTVLDNGDAPGGGDDMGARRIVRTHVGGAAQAVVGDILALRTRQGSTTTVDVIADGGRPLVVDLRFEGTATRAEIVGRPDATTAADESEILNCADTCLLIEEGRVRAAATGRQLSLAVDTP